MPKSMHFNYLLSISRYFVSAQTEKERCRLEAPKCVSSAALTYRPFIRKTSKLNRCGSNVAIFYYPFNEIVSSEKFRRKYMIYSFLAS